MRALSRREFVASTMALTAAGGAAAQDGLPKSMTIIVPFPPGASNDIFARLLAQKLSARLGNTVIVDNKPGAGGTIGAAFVSRAAPNGATLMLTSSTFTGSAAVQASVPYDALTGFTPIAQLAKGPMILAVSPTSKFASVADLVAAARAEKGKLNFGTAGIGSINHLAMELLSFKAGLDMTHVPYKGIASAITDLIGDRIDVVIASFPSIAGHMKAGKVRGLAVTSAQKSQFAPELAAIAETVPGYALDLWWGVFAPPQLPQALLERLSGEILAIIDEPEMRERFAQEGAVPTTLSPAAFRELVRNDLDVLRRVAKERKISAE